MAYTTAIEMVKDLSQCRNAVETISFVGILLAVFTAGLAVLFTKSGRFMTLLAMNHMLIHSRRVKTIIQTQLVPAFPEDIQALIESGNINLPVSVELQVIALFAALIAWYASPKKVGSTSTSRLTVQTMILLVATHLAVRSQIAATFIERELVPRLPIKTQALVESGEINLQFSVELLVIAVIMAVVAWYTSPTKMMIIEEEPAPEVPDENDDLLIIPSGKDWFENAARRGLSWRVLGISASPGEQEINHGFRMRAWRYHPDQPHGDADIFRICNEAKETLTSKPESKLYLDL